MKEFEQGDTIHFKSPVTGSVYEFVTLMNMTRRVDGYSIKRTLLTEKNYKLIERYNRVIKTKKINNSRSLQI